MSRSRVFFRVIVGGYLAYTGFSLAGRALSERPDNYIIYAIVGILFLIAGVAWCASALIRIAKHDYVDNYADDEPEIEDDTDTEKKDEES